MDKDVLKQLWIDAGGSFHGPNVETGTMPEELLLPFLQVLINMPAVKACEHKTGK